MRNIGGTTWRAQIFHGGAWETLRDQSLSWNPNNNYSIQAIEYFAPAGTSLPLIDADQTFTSTTLDVGGSWASWNASFPTVAAQAAELDGVRFMAFDDYFHGWRVSETVPALTQSVSPSSLTILPGSSGSATVSVTSNKTYDSYEYFEGPVEFTVTGEPLGIEASVAPVSLALRANQTRTATLTVQVLLPQLSPVELTVRGCGSDGSRCRNSKVTITTL